MGRSPTCPPTSSPGSEPTDADQHPAPPNEVTAVNAARWSLPLQVLLWLVVLRHVKWAILEWILGSRQVTLDVGVRGTTLSSSLDPNQTVICGDRISSGSLSPV